MGWFKNDKINGNYMNIDATNMTITTQGWFEND